MKRFTDLTPAQQKQALQHCLEDLLQRVAQGSVRFDNTHNNEKPFDGRRFISCRMSYRLYRLFNGAALQARIDRIIEEAPDRFAPDILFQDEYVKERLTAMSEADAWDAYYPECYDMVIRLTEVK